MKHHDENPQAETGRIMSAVSERARTPWEVADELHRLSEKYAGPSAEHRLLREASVLIGALQGDLGRETGRAERAERTAALANAKMKLAKLALDAVHVDG